MLATESAAAAGRQIELVRKTDFFNYGLRGIEAGSYAIVGRYWQQHGRQSHGPEVVLHIHLCARPDVCHQGLKLESLKPRPCTPKTCTTISLSSSHRFGCSYDVEKDSCTACHADDPDVILAASLHSKDCRFEDPKGHAGLARTYGRRRHHEGCDFRCWVQRMPLVPGISGERVLFCHVDGSP